ncbi:Phosphoenolpyruvate-protein phosphotransferase [compost metagenome]
MNRLTGIAASPGIAVARAFILEHPDCTVTKTYVSDANDEIAKLEVALEKSKGELQHIKQRTWTERGEKKAEIF